MRRSVCVLAPLAILFSLVGQRVEAVNRTVPDPYDTIQEAIDASAAGDEVIVTSNSGSPYAAFTLNKAIPVLKDTPSEIIIAAGGSDDWAARITTAGASVDGLTLRSRSNGKGAVEITADAEISDCVLADNGNYYSEGLLTISSTGAGARVDGCTFTITASSHGAGLVINASTSQARTEVVDCNFAAYLTYQAVPCAIDVLAATYPPLIHGNTFTFSGPYQYEGGAVVAEVGFEATNNIMEDIGYGFYLNGGSGYTITNNSVVLPEYTGTTYGIWFQGVSSSASTFSNNLFENMEYGLRFDDTPSGNWSINHNAYWKDSGGGAASNYSLSGTQIATDLEPIFCGGREGVVEEYSHRIDSEVAKGNNGWSEIIGALDVECAWDTLAYNATVAPGTTFTVLEDVAVPSGKTLAMGTNVTARFDADDDGGAGSDSYLNEIRVLSGGTLDINGSSGQTVKFQAASGTAEGTWYGIEVKPGGAATIDYAEIKHAEFGSFYGSTSMGHIRNSVFSLNEDADIAAGAGSGTMDLAIEDNTVTVGAGIGILLQDYCSGVTVDGNTVTCSGSSTDGIRLDSFTDNHTPVISSNSVSGASNGAGILLYGADATVRENSVSSCKQGISILDGDPLIGTSSTSSDNTLTSCTTGLLVEKTGSYSPVPIVRNNEIHSNTYGVQVKGNANPDIGTGTGGNRGLNDLTGNNTYCIWNRNTSQQVRAQGNYFGTCDQGSPPVCWWGSVDYGNWECSEPSSQRMEFVRVDGEAQGLRALGASPNPLRSQGELLFTVAAGSGAADVKVFNVAGRLVRDFGRVPVSAGLQHVAWDGHDDGGRPVGSGLYFVRVALDGEETATAKAFVVR